jgi:hypothetical protein
LAISGVASWVLLSRAYDDVYLIRRFIDDDLAMGGRDQLFAEAFVALKNAPLHALLFGYGPGGVSEVLRWTYGAHSGWVRLLLDCGLPCFALYLLWNVLCVLRLRRSVRRPWRLNPEAQVLFLSIVSFLIAESMVIQMLGVDVFYLLYVIVFALHLRHLALAASRRLDSAGTSSVSCQSGPRYG